MLLKLGKRKNQNDISLKAAMGIVIFVGLVALIQRAVVTMPKETITAFIYIVGTLTAALIVSAVVLLPFFLLQMNKNEPRQRRGYAKGQANVVYLNAPMLQPMPQQEEEPETRADRLLQMKPDKINWKVVKDETLELKVFGSEDKEW